MTQTATPVLTGSSSALSLAPSATALISGLLFGIGLVVSGMVDPARVLGFLDIFGAWDPSLAFVMGGALIPMAIAWRWKARQSKPVFDSRFHMPGRTAIDRRLILGAVLFGLGWGIAGLCPGPAIAVLVSLRSEALIFAVAMFAGFALYRLLLERVPAPEDRD